MVSTLPLHLIQLTYLSARDSLIIYYYTAKAQFPQHKLAVGDIPGQKKTPSEIISKDAFAPVC
jgi:hypothetical protein